MPGRRTREGVAEGALSVAAPGAVRQGEEIQAGEQEQSEWEERGEVDPLGGRLLCEDNHCDNGHGQREGDGDPAVGLAHPLIPVQRVILSRHVPASLRIAQARDVPLVAIQVDREGVAAALRRREVRNFPAAG